MTKKITNSSPRRLLLVCLFYIAMIFIAYSDALNGTWAMDDILLNKSVGMNDIKDIIGFRKITYLTFLINQSITPLSAAGFRVFNIFLHVVNTILIYLVAYKTVTILSTEQEKTQKRLKRKGSVSSLPDDRAFAVALLSGIIFGLHPININAVTYIVQRMAALSTFFCLLALFFYIRAYQSEDRLKRLMFYTSCGISITLGILSKENAVMAIPLILLYDYLFLSGLNLKTFLRKVSLFLIIGIISVGIASYLLKLHYAFIDLVRIAINPDKPLTPKGWMAVDVYWTPLQHFLTEFRVVSRYLLLISFPLPRLFVFDWWGYPVSTSLLKPLTTLLSVAFVLSFLLLAILRIRRLPLLSFGILWYFIAISLESFFALGSDLYFEHRNYLPVSGLFIGVIGQMILSLRINLNSKRPWVVAVILGIALGSLTFIRNLSWKDSITLWGDTLNKVPYNIRAMKALGSTYLRLYDLKTSEAYFLKAIKESSIRGSPQFLDESVFAMGMIYLYKGELSKAKELIDRYQTIIESYRPLILKGYYDLLNDDLDSALLEFDRVKGAEGLYKMIVFTLKGDTYRHKGFFDKAMEEYQKAISEDVSWASAYHGIGVTYMLQKDIKHAEEYFKKALSVEPDNVLVLSDMADLMLIKGEDPEKALSYMQTAVSKNPPFYQPYLAMGNVLLFMGKEEEAERFYNEALVTGAKDYMIMLNKARVYYLKGDHKKTREYLQSLSNKKDLPSRIKEMIGN